MLVGSSQSVKLVVPRRSHTATFVDCDRLDVYEGDLQFCTIPNDKQMFKNELLSNTIRERSEEDKYPTQVTEVDAGLPSFEPQYGYSSTIPSALRGLESSQTSFSEQDERRTTFIQQATMQGSMVTSSSGISFHSKPSKYMEFRDVRKRYESFHTPKWLAESKPDVYVLVECGFFYTGSMSCHLGIMIAIRKYQG